jgi:hypothetical protein
MLDATFLHEMPDDRFYNKCSRQRRQKVVPGGEKCGHFGLGRD